MSDSAVRDLAALGVAVSYDNISRGLIVSGRLARMIKEDGISGETANPIIYEKAVSTTDAYDHEIAELARAGLTPEQIVAELWAHDVQVTCDVFLPVYEATNHVDGYVSLELPPQPRTRRSGHDRSMSCGPTPIASTVPCTACATSWPSCPSGARCTTAYGRATGRRSMRRDGHVRSQEHRHHRARVHDRPDG